MLHDPLHAELLYNAAMLATDLAFLAGLRRDRSRAMLVGGIGVGLLATLAFTILIAWWDGATIMIHVRLLAWGLFVHGPLVTFGAAALVRKTDRRGALVCAALGALLVGIATEAFWLGPRRLTVTRVRIQSDRLTRPVRIVVVADLQTDVIGPYERRALSMALAERPDLILLPGDYIQEGRPARRDALVAELNALLHELDFRAPLGVFAVRGNTEGYDWQRIFAGLPVTTVDKASRAFDAGELRVVALDVFDSFNTQVTIPRADPDRFQLVFGHGPDFALGDVDADLLVAGHTHGGQVVLPGIGPLITFSQVPRSWARGTTRLPSGATLVVSAGIGLERANAPRLRFLCPPEVVVIELAPRARLK